MIPEGKTTYEREILPSSAPPIPNIAFGIVGWKEEEEHHSLGTSTNDGRTFIRVTLNQGSPPNKETEDGKPDGFRILVQPLGPLYWIPEIGTHVVVAFPDNSMEAVGTAVLLGAVGGSPLIQ